MKPEAVYEDLNVAEIDPTQNFDINCDTQLVTVKDDVNLPAISAFRLLAAKLKELGRKNPILLKDCLVLEIAATARPLHPSDGKRWRSRVRGMPGHSNQISPCCARRSSSARCFRMASATRFWCAAKAGQGSHCGWLTIFCKPPAAAVSRPITSPVHRCGRTLFNLQTVTARIKARTEHLKGVKIAIMGCIVNGPGEMADADFGYVGGAPGKINLYVGKTPVKFNIPEAEAVDRLVDLVREHGKWVEAENQEQKVAHSV